VGIYDTFLYDAGQSVSIVNPARIKGFAQSELLRNERMPLFSRFLSFLH